MTTSFINQLPFLVKTGSIKLEEAQDKLWTDIYSHPENYGLKCLDEDQRSDFLIYLYHKFSQIITSYKTGGIDFVLYVRGCLKKNLNSWLRKQLKHYAANNCLSDQVLMEYEGKESDSDVMINENNHPNTKIKDKIFHSLSGKRKSMLQEYIHILACRACNELDENLIEKISSFLNIPLEKFRNEIETLRLKTQNKLSQRKQIIIRRNKAFYFRKKYLYELMRMDSESAAYEYLSRKLAAQTESWKQSNELLSHRFSVMPSNTEISDNTGLKPRKIYYYINHKKRSKNIFPFIEMPEDKKR